MKEINQRHFSRKSNFAAIVSPRTALKIAQRLRASGFYTLPVPIWNVAADLADFLKETLASPIACSWLADALADAFDTGAI